MTAEEYAAYAMNIHITIGEDKDENTLEDYIIGAFKAGMQEMQQQMLKNAVSGTIEFVERDGMCKPTILYEPNPNNKLQLGENVKIIILKDK